uniref:Uncharacterized protein n=1 Tax=Tanacetum cinerariifolium TaxID=118510 RepID=A0A6L2MS31_TANCI|nr:hypothetical protein [Tanacetum cinerariifolium]
MMFAFICFVPIPYGREAGILMRLPQSDCCCNQDIGCDDLYNMVSYLIRESKSILTFACNDDNIYLPWLVDRVPRLGNAATHRLCLQPSWESGDDNNYLFTMLGSPSPSPWQGSHTQIVVATVVGIWCRIGGNGSKATTSADEPADDIASSSAHIRIGLLQLLKS